MSCDDKQLSETLEALVSLVEGYGEPYPYVVFPAVMKLCCATQLKVVLAAKLGVTTMTIDRWATDAFRPCRDMHNRTVGSMVEREALRALVTLRDEYRTRAFGIAVEGGL